jgi:hypothetical protein
MMTFATIPRHNVQGTASVVHPARSRYPVTASIRKRDRCSGQLGSRPLSLIHRLDRLDGKQQQIL